MVMRCTAVCLVALMVFCSFCDGQWSHFFRPSPRAYPIPRATVLQSNPQVPTDGQQSTQISKPLTWHYPAPPQGESIPVGPSSPKVPVPVSSVAVTCMEKSAHVEVKEDLFGTGQLINPAYLTLGTCGATAEDSVAKVLIFDVELQACGSTLSMTNDSIIYSFILNYNPQSASNLPVVRTSSTAVFVQCHYPRIQNVSSHPVNPYWSPFSAIRVAQEFLYFNMTLMTDDWQYLRPNYQYAMGDMIKIQVSVMQYFHVPLRVYVDSCIATLSSDTSSSPSYVFIDHGCMLDGMLTGSASQFMPRTVDNKLQFQLEAFKFQGASSGILYITCHLIATTTSYAIDSDHRACSYINGWKEASGFDSACASCYSGGSSGSSPPGPGTGSSGASPGSASSPGVGLGGTGSLGTSIGPIGSLGVGGSGSLNTGTGPTGSLGVGVGASGPWSTGPGPTGSLGVGGSGSLNTGTGPTGSLGVGVGASGPSSTGPGPTGSLGVGGSGSLNTGTGPTGSLGVGGSGSLNTGTGPTGSLGVGGSGPWSTGTGPTGSLGVGASGPWSTGTGPTGSLGVGASGPWSTGTGPTGSLGVGASGPWTTGTGPTGSLGVGASGPWSTGTGPTGSLGVGASGPWSTGTGPTGSLGVGASGPWSTGTGPTGSSGPGLGATGSSGSGLGVTGSFGTFGTVHNFPPFYNARKTRDVSHSETFEWEAQICMGPIQIEEVPV